MQNPQAAQAIQAAHNDRAQAMAKAWCEIVSRKAIEAGWSPALALSSAQSVRAFDSITDRQFCCGLRVRAKTSRPNDTTFEDVRALLVEKLSRVERTVLCIAEQIGWTDGGGGTQLEGEYQITADDRALMLERETSAAIASYDQRGEP